MTYDDETLMAFADGELSPDRAREVESACRTDPLLAARVERFRKVREAVGEAARGAAPAPRPGILEEAMRRTGAGPAQGAVRRWPLALAASLAGLFVGIGGGLFVGRTSALDMEAGMVARRELASALQRAPSGQTRESPGLDVQPLYTVIASDGRPCRAFQAVSRRGAVEGAGCRDDGVWRIVALAPVERPAAEFLPAASVEPPAVAAAIAALGPGDPLDAAAERALMRRAWRP